MNRRFFMTDLDRTFFSTFVKPRLALVHNDANEWFWVWKVKPVQVVAHVMGTDIQIILSPTHEMSYNVFNN